jgi:hypothetical protein
MPLIGRVRGQAFILASGNLLVFLCLSLLEDHLALGDIFTRTGERALHNPSLRSLAFDLEYESNGPSTGALNKLALRGAPSTLSLSIITSSNGE